MELSYDNPCLALVVHRDTRRVIDAAELPDVWNLRAVLERHDLTKVDVILRARERTQEPTPPEIENEPVAPATFDTAPDDDVPF